MAGAVGRKSVPAECGSRIAWVSLPVWVGGYVRLAANRRHLRNTRNAEEPKAVKSSASGSGTSEKANTEPGPCSRVFPSSTYESLIATW